MNASVFDKIVIANLQLWAVQEEYDSIRLRRDWCRKLSRLRCRNRLTEEDHKRNGVVVAKRATRIPNQRFKSDRLPLLGSGGLGSYFSGTNPTLNARNIFCSRGKDVGAFQFD